MHSISPLILQGLVHCCFSVEPFLMCDSGRSFPPLKLHCFRGTELVPSYEKEQGF